MNALSRLVPAVILAAALGAAGASGAAEPEAMATAPTTATGAPPSSPAPSVADQIDSYLKTSPAIALPKDGANGVTSGEEPRRAHSVIDVAVGSGGYRSAFMQTELPVGKTGTVSIAVGETHFDGRLGGRFGDRFGPQGSQTLGLGFGLGDAALEPRDLRCRQAGEQGPDPRLDPRLEGGRPRPCHTAEAPTSPQ